MARDLERKILDLLLDRLKGLGLVSAGGRQRTDSTHVLAAIRGLNRLELAGETVRVKLAEQYGRDGYHLLEAVHAPGAPGWLRELPAVQALRVIWVQQYYRVIDEHGEKVIRREAREHGVPPGRLKLVSPYDLDARYCEKRGKGWEGYKVHLSETCGEPEPDGTRQAPNLITGVATTAATVPDAAMTDPVHDRMAAAGLTPGEHAVDAGSRLQSQESCSRPGPSPPGQPPVTG